MFDFEEQPLYESEPPTLDYFTGRYCFWLYAAPSVCEFVSKLPCVESASYEVDSGVLLVFLCVTVAFDQISADCHYEAVMCSVEAHLDPPLGDQWETAIREALAQP